MATTAQLLQTAAPILSSDNAASPAVESAPVPTAIDTVNANANNSGQQLPAATGAVAPTTPKPTAGGGHGIFFWRTTNAAGKSLDDPLRFHGDGIDFKAKLIGIQDVAEPRGDQMCQEAVQVAKALVKASGQHKQRIYVNISLEGLKIKDATSNQVLYSFPVHKISFIARDVTDSRAFGFVYGTPDSQHKFYGIKTERTSDIVVLAIRDMFHTVYEMKKRQIEDAKKGDESSDNSFTASENNKTDQNANMTNSGTADLLNLQTELQTIQQGIDDLAWVGFSEQKEMGSGANLSQSGSSGLPTSSTSGFTGSSLSNLNESASSAGDEFSNSSGQWGQLKVDNFASTNPFASVAATPGAYQQPPSTQNNSALLFGSDLSFNLSTPTVLPPAGGAAGFGMPGGAADPFNTAHATQLLLNKQSTPAPFSGFNQQLGPSPFSGMNFTQQPSLIRPDDSSMLTAGGGNNSSVFQLSNSLFDSSTSNFGNSQLGGSDLSALNQGFNDSKFQLSSGGGSLFDEPLAPMSAPGLADPITTPAKSKVSAEDFATPKSTGAPATIDDAFSSLCNLDSLASTKTAFQATVKQSPFDGTMKNMKKSINEMRDVPTANAPSAGNTMPPMLNNSPSLFGQGPSPTASMSNLNAFASSTPAAGNPFLGAAQPQPASLMNNPFFGAQQPSPFGSAAAVGGGQFAPSPMYRQPFPTAGANVGGAGMVGAPFGNRFPVAGGPQPAGNAMFSMGGPQQQPAMAFPSLARPPQIPSRPGAGGTRAPFQPQQSNSVFNDDFFK